MLANLATDVHGHTVASVALILLGALAFLVAAVVHRDIPLPRWRLAISIGLVCFAVGVAVS